MDRFEGPRKKCGLLGISEGFPSGTRLSRDDAREEALGEKEEALGARLAELGPLLLLLSGGTDSAALALAALRVPEARPQALTFLSPLDPEAADRARRVAERLRLDWKVREIDELADPLFAAHSPDRCYRCRRIRHALARRIARAESVGTLADGALAEDRPFLRPGMRAAEEDGVRSPLREAGWTKADVRAFLTREGYGDLVRPSRPCLATRFPYGIPLRRADLDRVRRAEAELADRGFPDCRVRAFPYLAALVEVPERDLPRALELRGEILRVARRAGFDFVSLDLEGLRSGKMERTAPKADHPAEGFPPIRFAGGSPFE